MSGEWKHGDVAMAAWTHFRGVPAIYTKSGWVDIDAATFDGHEDDLDLRPLVVIDAEDAEQVERLAKLLWPHYSDVESARLCKTEITAEALREFANPTPRIEEPLERWSRVFDGEGREWCRTEWDGSLDKPWQHDGTHAHWSALSKHHGPITPSPGVPS